MSKRKKKYWNMTTEELTEATQEFDQEDVAETFRGMTTSEEAAWQSAVQKRPNGRQRNDKGGKVISLGIEARLLKRVDAVAKKRGVSRDELLAEGLGAVLTKREK